MVSEEKYLCGNSLAAAHAVPEAAGERGMCSACYKIINLRKGMLSHGGSDGPDYAF